jgi:ribosome maturation protein Sdo1
LWLLRGAVKNKEVAERILRERRGELTEEQRRYLLETIRMGEEAERYIRMVEKECRGSP